MQTFNFKKNNFDAIRLFAAFQVAFVHAYSWLDVQGADWLVKAFAAFPGVPIFFVVSGFLISASFERSSSLSLYMQNRFLRIYPALWVCFLISVLTILLFFNGPIPLREFVLWSAAQISIGQFYNPDFLRSYGIGVANGSLWTIPVELQFYLLLPVIYIVFQKFNWNRYFLLAIFVLLIAINQFFVALRLDNTSLIFKLFGVTVAPYLYMFLLGVLLQRNIDFVENVVQKNLGVILGLHLLMVPIAITFGLNYGSNYLNPFSALTLALLTISVAYNKVDQFGNVLRGNDISYGVYIYHMVFVNVFLETNVLGAWPSLVVALCLTFVAAYLSWRYVEKPALALKRYSIQRSS